MVWGLWPLPGREESGKRQGHSTISTTTTVSECGSEAFTQLVVITDLIRRRSGALDGFHGNPRLQGPELMCDRRDFRKRKRGACV